MPAQQSPTLAHQARLPAECGLFLLPESMLTRPLVRPIVGPIVRRVIDLARALGRIVQPGDYLLDESGNYLTDESGNRITG